MATLDYAGIPALMHGLTYEQNKVGDKFRTATRTITETDLVSFVSLAGLNEPLFLDEQGSVEANYSGRLVPGTLVFSYAEGLVMQTGAIHGTGMAFLQAGVDVKGPVFVGDTILVVVEVTESRAASSGTRGIVTTRNSVLKRDGTLVLEYTPVRLIRGGEPA